jgi:hypothetical protein
MSIPSDFPEDQDDYVSEKDYVQSLKDYVEEVQKRMAALEKVAYAARNLRAEVLGLNIANYKIMQAIGQTNWSVLKQRSVELREAFEYLDETKNV